MESDRPSGIPERRHSDLFELIRDFQLLGKLAALRHRRILVAVLMEVYAASPYVVDFLRSQEIEVKKNVHP